MRSTTNVMNSTTHRSNAATATASPVLEKPVLSRSFCSRLVAAANAWNFPLLVPLLLSVDGGGAAIVPLFFSVTGDGSADAFRQGSRSSSVADRQPSGLSCISKFWPLFLRSCAIVVVVVTLQRCTSEGSTVDRQVRAPPATLRVSVCNGGKDANKSRYYDRK